MPKELTQKESDVVLTVQLLIVMYIIIVLVAWVTNKCAHLRRIYAKSTIHKNISVRTASVQSESIFQASDLVIDTKTTKQS